MEEENPCLLYILLPARVYLTRVDFAANKPEQTEVIFVTTSKQEQN